MIDCSTPAAPCVQQLEKFLAQKKPRIRMVAPSPSPAPLPTQLPLWAETVRLLPSEIVRSALFNARNRKQPRVQLKDAEIATIGGGRIIIDEGWEMRQDEESIVLELLHMAKGRPLDQVIEFTHYSFCKAIGWSNDPRSFKATLIKSTDSIGRAL